MIRFSARRRQPRKGDINHPTSEFWSPTRRSSELPANALATGHNIFLRQTRPREQGSSTGCRRVRTFFKSASRSGAAHAEMLPDNFFAPVRPRLAAGFTSRSGIAASRRLGRPANSTRSRHSCAAGTSGSFGVRPRSQSAHEPMADSPDRPLLAATATLRSGGAAHVSADERLFLRLSIGASPTTHSADCTSVALAWTRTV